MFIYLWVLLNNNIKYIERKEYKIDFYKILQYIKKNSKHNDLAYLLIYIYGSKFLDKHFKFDLTKKFEFGAIKKYMYTKTYNMKEPA